VVPLHLMCAETSKRSRRLELAGAIRELGREVKFAPNLHRRV
jgi:hypothetical protein